MWEIKNRVWKPHQRSITLIPDGGMCPAFGPLWGAGAPRLADQESHHWWSHKQVLNIFLLLLLCKNTKAFQSFGKTPGQSHITSGRKPLLHSRWSHWATWCQQWWPGPQSLLCLQHLHSSRSQPPFQDAGFLWYVLSLASSMGLLGLAVTLHGTFWHLPSPKKGTKDITGHDLAFTPHKSCPPAMSFHTQNEKIVQKKWGENAQISDFLDNPDIGSLGLGVTLWQRQTPQFALFLALFHTW